MARNFEVTQARRENLKARIAISAPSGSGKTSAALWLAESLAGPDGEILVVDTERGSAKLYSKPPGSKDDGTVFKHIDFGPPYAPLDLADLIDTHASSCDVMIIDSLSHFWNGPGGVLEIANRSNNKVQGWATATPMQDRMISSLLTASCHIICTTRAKIDTQLEKDDRTGKLKVRTFGMKSVQREDVIYEFTIVLGIDKESHMMSVTKTRMRSIEGHTFQTPGDVSGLGRTIHQWLNAEDNSEAAEAADSMELYVESVRSTAAEAVGSLTEEEVVSANMTDEQVQQIMAVFSNAPEGPVRTSAKELFNDKYGNPKNLNTGLFETVLTEASEMVSTAQATT